MSESVKEKSQAFNPPTLQAWAREVDSDVEPTYIIPGFIPSDNLILLSGAPKDAMKTWFSMLTALIAATGKSVGLMTCPKAVPVLYIYREGARVPTQARFKALAKGHNLGSIYDIQNLYFYHRGPFRLDGQEGGNIQDVIAFIVKKGIKLVYIDTFAKSCQSEENNAKEMGGAIRQVDLLRDAGATVVLVHHIKKGSHALDNGKSGHPKPDADIRGSSALAGAYETHWAVRSYPEPGQKRESVLLVGGKEFDWVQYGYDWQFPAALDRHTPKPIETLTLELTYIGQPQAIAGPANDKFSE